MSSRPFATSTTRKNGANPSAVTATASSFPDENGLLGRGTENRAAPFASVTPTTGFQILATPSGSNATPSTAKLLSQTSTRAPAIAVPSADTTCAEASTGAEARHSAAIIEIIRSTLPEGAHYNY